MRLNETSPSKFARASAATLMGRRRHNRKALLARTALSSTRLSFVSIAMATAGASAQTTSATSPSWAGYVATGQGPYTHVYGS